MLELEKITELKRRTFELGLTKINSVSGCKNKHHLTFVVNWSNEKNEWNVMGNSSTTYSAVELKTMLNIVEKLNKKGCKGEFDV